MALISRVGRRAGSDPEWVRGFDAGEIDGEISHGKPSFGSTRILLFQLRHADWAIKAGANRFAFHAVTGRLEGTGDFLPGEGCVDGTGGLFAFGDRVDYLLPAVGAVAPSEDMGHVRLPGVRVFDHHPAFVQFERRKEFL